MNARSDLFDSYRCSFLSSCSTNCINHLLACRCYRFIPECSITCYANRAGSNVEGQKSPNTILDLNLKPIGHRLYHRYGQSLLRSPPIPCKTTTSVTNIRFPHAYSCTALSLAAMGTNYDELVLPLATLRLLPVLSRVPSLVGKSTQPLTL